MHAIDAAAPLPAARWRFFRRAIPVPLQVRGIGSPAFAAVLMPVFG